MTNITRFLSIVITCLGMAMPAFAQQSSSSKDYLQRAEAMYANVWSRYRVARQEGLFLENFPSTKNDTITYMEGGGVKEKEVSFLWPFSGVFSACNVLIKYPGLQSKYKRFLDSCVTGVEKYRDDKRSPVGYQAYPAIFEKSDRYYDDNGLVAIDYMEAYFNTKNPVYLQRAKEIFAFIVSGWNNDLGGGVTWLEGHLDQKPACSNGSATLAALKTYQGSKDTFYLNWGIKFYDWMYNNLLDSSGVYANDKKMDRSINKTFWTYNSGWMLEAGVLLYEFTKDKKYLVHAQQVAKSAYDHFSKASKDTNLILHIDLPWFVTVLFRGYEALYYVDGNYKYIAAVEHDLNYAWKNSRDKYGFVTHSWSAKEEEIAKPKWLLDEACIAELYARLGLIAASKSIKIAPGEKKSGRK